MSTSIFSITSHTVPAQYIREYRYATEHEDSVLHLHVTQYRPLSNLKPQPGDVTLIGAHGNGFPKEVYEPLWDDILVRAEKAGIRIRAIWIADAAHLGQSSVINEDLLGNDPSWLDHPRDLLHIINHFRAEMPRPLVGIGHSMGANNMVQLSTMHPRLFHSVVLIDPVISRIRTSASFSPAYSTIMRRDMWPSREEASKAFNRSPFYQAWDSRALAKFIQFGLRDLPTRVYPGTSTTEQAQTKKLMGNGITNATPVTLTSTKFQETLTYARLNEGGASSGGGLITPSTPPSATSLLLRPDINPVALQDLFYRSEPIIAYHNLSHLRPSALYIYGETSQLSPADHRADQLATTGTELGGNGGEAAGRVKGVVIPRAGHLVPIENPTETADAAVNWLTGELIRWKQEDEILSARWAKIPKHKQSIWTDQYQALMIEAAKSDRPPPPPKSSKPKL